MEKMELHRAPCRSGEALNGSNRATGDRPRRRGPALALASSPSKRARAARSEGLQRAAKDRRVFLVSLRHRAERKTSFSFPGPARPSPGSAGWEDRLRHRLSLPTRVWFKPETPAPRPRPQNRHMLP